MCKSMTGYGRASFEVGGDVDGNAYTVEVKSLNHRYLDVKVRLPERFSSIEIKVREVVKAALPRGSVAVNVNEVRGADRKAALNIPLVKRYLDAEMELKHTFGLEGDVDVRTLLSLREIFTPSGKDEGGGEEGATPETAQETAMKKSSEAFISALKEALGAVVEMRKAEGVALKADICSRLDTIDTLVGKVEGRVPQVNAEYRERLEEKLKEFLAGSVDEHRILTEVAIFSERGDVSEEVTRFRAHVQRTREYLCSDDPVGRKLDFLCQELGRETNTMGSKSSDVECTQTVVEIKGELEKVREQVQNIE